MKKYITFFVCFLTILPCFGQFRPDNDKFNQFFDVLIKIESGGKANAIGDNGAAIGPAQIHKSYWRDTVQYDKSIGGKYEDCFNLNYSKKIVYSYMSRYCKTNDIESFARCHNSGPTWKNKTNLTNNYWNRYKKYL